MKQGQKLTIKENKSYYLTMTVVGWIDIFTRKAYCDIIVDSLQYCIKEKGLNLYAYVIMSNHLHLIVNCNEPFQLKDTIRDFKKFTSKKILLEIQNGVESRREWMLKFFKEAGNETIKNKTYKLWKTGNHAIELYNQKFTWDKVNYIHQNPVKAGFVERSIDWLYSSAKNYEEMGNVKLKQVECLMPILITV
jgi:REP element-mobilizing transposase RayT